MTNEWMGKELRSIEDDGVAAVMGSGGLLRARAAALADGVVRSAVRDELQAAFQAAERRVFLDPFAPADARNTEVVAVLRAAIDAHRASGGPLTEVPSDRETLLHLYAETLGWGPAQRYLDDPRVNEVKLIGTRIRVQEAGGPFVTVPECFTHPDEVQARAQLLAAALGVRLDAESPQATLPLDHGSRMHVSIPPRTLRGALVCIRRGRQDAWTLADVVARGMLDARIAALLGLFSQARCAMLIAGRTGSGKTTLLEALANSWPGAPHILTIEEHTREIGIRRTDLWTAQHVDTQRDSQAFGRVAREALRQTPDLLLPGEIRGSEAGAVLALALSDHPVVTTLHARTCAEAVTRFATYAALPGAIMYEGRRDDALRDTCAAFTIVISVALWEGVGRRVISEIGLITGSVVVDGAVVPQICPLAQVRVDGDGTIGWDVAAQVGTDGQLCWEDGQDHTPPLIRTRLAHAQVQLHADGRAPTIDRTALAIERAEGLLHRGQALRAIAVLREVWADRQDTQVLALAHRAISQAPQDFDVLLNTARAHTQRLHAAMAAGAWAEAQAVYTELWRDVGSAAAALPLGGWGPLAAQIQANLAEQAQVQTQVQMAATALVQGDAHAALLHVQGVEVARLSQEEALAVVQVRERALTQLVAQGAGSAEALAAVRAQRVAYGRGSGGDDA